MEKNKKHIQPVLNNNNIQNVFHKQIKRECDENVDFNIEIKLECCELEEIKKEVDVHEVAEDLYKDHVIKEELVIGPEVIQEVHQSNAYKNDIADSKVKKEFIHKHKIKREIDIDESEIKKEKEKDIDECENKKEKDVEKCKENVCSHCKKSFISSSKLKSHMKHNHQSHRCHECGKVFTFAPNLIRHSKIHTGVKTYQCPQCDKSFARNDYLKFHVQRHHLNMKVSYSSATCELCNKEFAKKFSRDHHKKYSCPMNKSKMKLIKNKLYWCDDCGKSYMYRTSLTAHIMRRHMKRVIQLHQCDHCGMKYVKKHNLQCHMQVQHLNVFPYPCKECKETFKWHSTLATHMRKVHGPNKTKMHGPTKNRRSKMNKIQNIQKVKLELFDSCQIVNNDNS